MIYELLENTPQRVAFATHPRAQRGRGVLFATSPLVVYLLTLGLLFFLATQDLSLWGQVKQTAKAGLWVVAGLSAACFALGYRIRDTVEATSGKIRASHRPALGPAREKELAAASVRALALEPSLRSLGADVLLVAVLPNGDRVPLAEGEPHSGQIQALAKRMAEVTQVRLEPPKGP